MLKLKLQYFGHLMWLIGKDPDAGKDWGQEEKRKTEDEMVGWHDQLKGHEFEQIPGDSKRKVHRVTKIEQQQQQQKYCLFLWEFYV